MECLFTYSSWYSGTWSQDSAVWAVGLSFELADLHHMNKITSFFCLLTWWFECKVDAQQSMSKGVSGECESEPRGQSQQRCRYTSLFVWYRWTTDSPSAKKFRQNNHQHQARNHRMLNFRSNITYLCIGLKKQNETFETRSMPKCFKKFRKQNFLWTWFT